MSKHLYKTSVTKAVFKYLKFIRDKMKKVIVISVGGSLILSERNDKFLLELRRVLRKHYTRYKFVLECGGGSVAREYIRVLSKAKQSKRQQSNAGIRATRMNAEFLMQLFGKEANNELPLTMKKVRSELHKNSIVICGALRYEADNTSDATAVELAHYLKAPFVNMTNVSGLYDADPRISKKAKLIKSISWKEFEAMAKKIRYKPGQHFVLDQKGAKLIMKHKIPAYIIGNDVKNLEKILENKKFAGTLIS